MQIILPYPLDKVFGVMYSLLYENSLNNVKELMENKFLLLSERAKRELSDFLPNDTHLLKMANFFYGFADPTRLKILTCLCIADMCVNDLAKTLNLNQTTVSHQLQILRNQGFVEFQRFGKILVYKLHKKAVNDIMLTAVDCL